MTTHVMLFDSLCLGITLPINRLNHIVVNAIVEIVDLYSRSLSNKQLFVTASYDLITLAEALRWYLPNLKGLDE